MSLKINKNYFWNTSGSLMYALNTILLLLLVSRFSGIGIAGAFGISFTNAQILYIVGIFGVSHYQMTDYQKKYPFSVYLTLKLISSLLMMLLVLIPILLYGFFSPKALMTLFLSLYMCINSVAEVFQNLLFQENKINLSGKSLFVRMSISFIAFALILILFKNIYAAILGMILPNIITTYITGTIPSKNYAKIKLSYEFKDVSRLMLECFPIFIITILMTVMNNCSKYAVEYYLNDTVLGYYNIIFMLVMIIGLINSFIFRPILHKFAANMHNRKVFNRLLARQILIILSITAVICIGALLIGIRILEFLYGISLSEYISDLILVIIGSGIYGICAFLYYIIIIYRQQTILLIGYSIAMAVSVTLSFVLTKYYSFNGAVYSYIFSQIFLVIILVLILFIIRKRDNYEH